MPKSQKNGLQKQNEVSQWIFLAPGMINNETLLVSILPSTGIVAKIARPYFVILAKHLIALESMSLSFSCYRGFLFIEVNKGNIKYLFHGAL